MHPYHIITPSPWPFLISIAVFTTAVGTTMYMHRYENGLLILVISLLQVILVMCLWWRDVIREATLEGAHTKRVQAGLRLGFILFLVSEVMFFFGFFMSFFYIALSPGPAIGCEWPPTQIVTFNPMGLPLVNTFLLLLSGATITFAHHSLIEGAFAKTAFGLCATILCATLFVNIQMYEYTHAAFSISDGIYGSIFYTLTGLHGVHVIIGTLFIFVAFERFLIGHYTRQHHFGFEASIWYWHFVDVVWIFLYVFIYVFSR